MRLSVVVPLYNCLPLTQAMVASLQSTLPAGLAHEIILVDDGSTDGTRDWLATLRAPFRVVLNESNRGYAASNNRGAALATGEFLGLLNNDLILTTGWLEPMLEAHQALGTRAGLVGNVQLNARTGEVDHVGILINHKGKPEHIREYPRSLFPNRLPSLKPVSAVTGACVLVARTLWMELGGFDETYVNGCEDVDLCLRAAAAGRLNVVALKSRVRHHVSSAPGRKDKDEANTYRLTLRWSDALVTLGLDDWCRHWYEDTPAEPPLLQDGAFAWRLFCYMTGMRRSPPPEAPNGMRAAIEFELERWRGMFGPMRF